MHRTLTLCRTALAGAAVAVLLTACGNRRESRCPSCAATYRADAYQLVRAGLDGGKGVPDSIAGHPRLFVTFTAPGFGPVHDADFLESGLYDSTT